MIQAIIRRCVVGILSPQCHVVPRKCQNFTVHFIITNQCKAPKKLSLKNHLSPPSIDNTHNCILGNFLSIYVFWRIFIEKGAKKLFLSNRFSSDIKRRTFLLVLAKSKIGSTLLFIIQVLFIPIFFIGLILWIT